MHAATGQALGSSGPVGSTTAPECLARLAGFRHVERCRRCEYLDWALSELQLVGDYPLACTAATLRPAADRLHASPGCTPCGPLDVIRRWLQPTAAAPPAATRDLPK